MKKIYIFFITVIISSICIILPIFANSQNTTVRVGLNSQVGTISTATISNSSLKIGFQKEGTFFGNDIVVGNNISVQTGQSYYISSSQTFTNFKDAQIFANNVGFPTLTDLGCWKVYFGGYSSKEVAEKEKANFTKFNANEVIETTKNITTLLSQNKIIAIFDNNNYCLQIKDGQGGNITINDKTYRGAIEFLKKGSSYNIINVLDIDEYLYGVLPCEVSNSWHKEALKAQAVVSRCFTVFTKNGKHSSDGYDLCDSTHCQVYKGVSVEKQETSEAINETKGIFAYYNNEIIESTYFSCSGGATADAYDVWGIDVPYLKPTLDSEEKNAKVWTRAFSFQEITDIAKSNNENIGTVNKVYIGSKDDNGRVNSLIIEGTSGNIILEKEKIRTFFSSSKEGSLLSRNFSMNNNSQNNFITEATKISVTGNKNKRTADFLNLFTINDKNEKFDFTNHQKISVLGNTQTKLYDKTTNKTVSQNQNFETVSGDVVFYGKGMGHGVGMSQMGAKALAEKGYNYIDILKYYYKGIEVK